MNNALVLHLSAAFAGRLAAECRAIRWAAGRPRLPAGSGQRIPIRTSAARAVRVVERAGPPALDTGLFNCNEFLYFD